MWLAGGWVLNLGTVGVITKEMCSGERNGTNAELDWILHEIFSCFRILHFPQHFSAIAFHRKQLLFLRACYLSEKLFSTKSGSRSSCQGILFMFITRKMPERPG